VEEEEQDDDMNLEEKNLPKRNGNQSL